MGFGNTFDYRDYFIKTDAFDNVYTTGRFDNTADFDPGQGTFYLSALGLYSDIFIQKLDSSGNFIWARSIEGTERRIAHHPSESERANATPDFRHLLR